MKNETQPWRVLIKAAFLFAVVNLIFAMANPPVGKITLFNTVFPGRLRFPYEQEPKYYFVGLNAPVYEDFDTMFGTHVISKMKSGDEFRLVLLGDSSTWGLTLQSGDTLSEQINNLGLQTCDGRKVRAYNLGYPLSFLVRDLLILDKAMEYQPDMIVWLITLSTLEPKAAETYFILPHADRYLRLVDAYNLSYLDLVHPVSAPSFFDRTIIGQRQRLKDILFTQALGILWTATGIDNHEGLVPEPAPPTHNVENNIYYDGRPPGDAPMIFDSLMMDAMSVGYDIAGDVPIVLVNQPIFIADGLNNQVRYDDIYPRWVYDEYRQFMFNWADINDRSYLDYWNALSQGDFSDQHFHRNPHGEKRFAAMLAPKLQKLVCFSSRNSFHDKSGIQ